MAKNLLIIAIINNCAPKILLQKCNKCNNGIIQCVNLINLYGGFPIFASKMGEVGKCVRII